MNASQPSDEIEILDNVNSGLYGRVYRALQHPFGRQVAVKIIKTDLKSAGPLAHASPLAQVNHPAIVTVFSLQTVHIPQLGAAFPAIIMEWIDGDTFGMRLSQKNFDADEALTICRDLLDAIEHLHNKGLCHGDLHGGNIIVLPNGHAKIIDIDANKEFSLSRLSSGSQQGAKAADIDYCRATIHKALRHSTIPPQIVEKHENEIDSASTIAALQNTLDDIEKALGLRINVSHKNDNWLDQFAMSRISDDAVVSLLDTQAYFDLRGVPYPEHRSTVLENLVNDGAIRQIDAAWEITNFGAILFAKKLESFGPKVASKAPRFILYDGVSKLKTKSDVPGTRGYAVGFGNLVEFVHNSAPQNKYVEVAVREEVKMFPKQALRELIANALVHQDFTVDGSPLRIEMYDDRVEISNPGKPTIPADRFIDEDRSRNERLAELMRRLGICERKGSGVDKVITAAEVFQLPAPEFRVGDVRTTAILFSHQDFTEMSKQARIRACYQHCVLQYISGKRMSNQSLRDRFGLSSSGAGSATASQIIAATKELELVKLDDEGAGSLKYARYVPWWG